MHTFVKHHHDQNSGHIIKASSCSFISPSSPLHIPSQPLSFQFCLHFLDFHIIHHMDSFTQHDYWESPGPSSKACSMKSPWRFMCPPLFPPEICSQFQLQHFTGLTQQTLQTGGKYKALFSAREDRSSSPRESPYSYHKPQHCQQLQVSPPSKSSKVRRCSQNLTFFLLS